MDSGFAVLGPSQVFYGYSLLICREPATELDDLEPWLMRQYLADMARLAKAVRRAVRPYKLNYEALGNQVHHLHWHIFPRREDEPTRGQPVWTCMPEGEEAEPSAFDPHRHGELLETLRALMLLDD